MHLTHKIALSPTPEQADYFKRACDAARFVWNWALAEWKRQHAAGGKPNAMALKKQFNAIKYNTFPWLKDIHRDAHARPFDHCAHRQHQDGLRSQADNPTLPRKPSGGDRGCARQGNAGEPQACSRHIRRGFWNVPRADGLQGEALRDAAHRG